MPSTKVRAVVFDLDGTLADTSEDLIAATNACFFDMGHDTPLLDPESDQLVAFQGARAMLSCGFERLDATLDRQALSEKYYPVFLKKYGENIDQHTTLYPRAVEALQMLSDDGWRLCVCTNKPEHLALDLLDRLGIFDCFHSIVGGDTFPMRKPDPRVYELTTGLAGVPVQNSFMVGDTIVDLQTARASNTSVVLVAFGPLGEAVTQFEPDALLYDYDQLVDMAPTMLK